MNKIVTTLVAALFCMVSVAFSQASFTLSPSMITGNTGETVTVSMTVNGFTDIVSMQYGIKWDPTVIRYDAVDNFNLTDLTAGNFNPDTDNGFLSFSWFDNSTAGVTVADGTVIYTMTFTVLGDANSGSAITFESRTGLAIEIATTNGEITNDVALNNSQFGDANNNAGGGNPPAVDMTPITSSITGTSGGTQSGDKGTTICLDVDVSNFTDITEMNYSLNWDASVLQYKEIQNINLAGLTQASFGTTAANSGQLSVNWADAQGQSLTGSPTIYQVCFDLVGNEGTSSAISFSSTPTPISVMRTGATTSVGLTPGNATIRINSVTPPPPASTGDNLVNVGTLNTPVGSTVCVPVTVNDFDLIASLQFSLQWDPSVLQFTEVRGFNLVDLTAGNFNTTQAASGRMALAWFDNTAQGVTLADGATIFEMCFTVLGANGTSSSIVFTDTPTSREAATPNATIDFTETNGVVTIGDGTIDPPPPPPPTTGGDNLVNLSTLSAESGTTVCIPVTVNDFNSIASLQFSLQWDPAVLQFDEVKNFNLPDLNAGSFNTTATSSGRTAMAWFDNTAQGVTLQDGATLFEICFEVIGATNANSTIVFTDTPTAREAANANTTVDFTQTDGTVTVGTGVIDPPPPPTGDGIVNIGEITATPNTNICVPVTAKDFNGIAAMQFSLAWDPAVLTFTGTQNFGLTDLTAGSFNTDNTANGQVAVAWFDNAAQGVTLADNEVIFEICFDVVGTEGTNTSITFTDTPTARELATASGTIDFLSTDGTITVGNDPPPPPTGDGIINIGEIMAENGTNVCIPVSVKDFNTIVSMQFSLAWDPSVLSFTGLGSDFGLTDLAPANFNVTGAANGQIAVAWFDNTTTGFTLADGTELFELCFDVVGAAGANTAITFTDTPTGRELATPSGTIDFSSSNGLFTVGMGEPVDTMDPVEPIVLDKLVNIAPTTITSGTDFCVPVVVNDFDDIASLQFSLGWDPAVLEFTGVQEFGLPDLTAAGFNVSGAANGAISMAWFDGSAQGVDLADGATLFEICFRAVGANGTNTTITFQDTPTPREAATSNATVDFTETNGIITVGEGGPVCAGPITATATATNVSCNGLSDGLITLTVSGGDNLYTYQWNDASIGNIPNPTGLAAGVYSVTITSCGGQETKSDIPAASLTITEPTAIMAVVTPQNASCFGENDGRINVSVTGGTQPYTYQWSDPTLAPANRPVNAGVGTYSVTITDNTGCTEEIDNISITSPTEITVTVNTTDASCSGAPDGTATLTASGGSGADYTYNWGVDGIVGANPTNVPSGDYMVTVTDGNQCTTEVPVTVGAVIVVSGTVQVIEDACGESRGAIQVTPSGGTEPYMYDWTGPADIGDTNTAENIPTGTYMVQVTDVNGCFFTESIEVGGPTATLSTSAAITDVDCPEDDNGSITLTSAGGFSPYTYAWSNDATTESISGLTPGEYTVTITDSKVCTYVETFTVVSTSNMTVSVEVTKGAPEATAVATVTGGVEPYTYEWCDGQGTATATGLDAGNCSLTVIDALGCTVVENFEIIVDNPVVSITMVSAIRCNGLTGTIQADVTGGQPGYSYEWNTGATTATLSDVGAGTYEVTVTDDSDNTGTASFELMEPAAIVISENENRPVCEMDGRISINIAGGTAPYKNIVWSNDINGALSIENLREGEYGVIVTDDNDCTAEENFRVLSDPNCKPCLESIKVMTPNDDGRNDAFLISCVDVEAPNNHLEVYNRWGQLVFEADNYSCVLGTESDCWRGRDRSGELVDEGGYFWVLEYDSPDGRKRIRDHVTILDQN
ncbi:MAG: cohesin domain-containing protein [Bacteroidota bacterium]